MVERCHQRYLLLMVLASCSTHSVECPARRLSVILHPNSFSPCVMSCSIKCSETDSNRQACGAGDFKSPVYTDFTIGACVTFSFQSTYVIYVGVLRLSSAFGGTRTPNLFQELAPKASA